MQEIYSWTTKKNLTEIHMEEREHTHDIHKSDSWSYINKVAQNEKICKEKKSCGLTICHSKMIKDENRKNTRRVM